MSTRKTGEDDRYKQLDKDIDHVANEVEKLQERVKDAEAKLAALGKREADNADEIRALRVAIAELRPR